MANENQIEPEVRSAHEDLPGLERRALQRHPAGLCRRCGEPVKGLRRNGYCSDRCRMRDRREREQARIDELLQRLEDDLNALRVELFGEVDS